MLATAESKCEDISNMHWTPGRIWCQVVNRHLSSGCPIRNYGMRFNSVVMWVLELWSATDIIRQLWHDVSFGTLVCNQHNPTTLARCEFWTLVSHRHNPVTLAKYEFWNLVYHRHNPTTLARREVWTSACLPRYNPNQNFSAVDSLYDWQIENIHDQAFNWLEQSNYDNNFTHNINQCNIELCVIYTLML